MKKGWMLVSVLVILSLIGCGTTAKPGEVEGTPSSQGDKETVPVVKRQNADTLIAEGTVQPVRAESLSLTASGEVVEVSAKAGDRVEADALLVRLDTDQLLLSLKSAEQDVIAQEAALAQLRKGASDKVIARADKANADQIAQAEVVLAIKQLQLERARAEDPSLGVAVVQARINQLQLGLTQSRAQDPKPSVTVAEVEVERARIVLEDTQDEYNKALDRPWEDQKIRDGWAKQLEQARLNYQAAQAQLDQARNGQRAHELGLSVLEAQVKEAEVQLAQAVAAQETYSVTLQMLEAEVKAAGLSLEALRTSDNPYRDPPSDEQVTQAQAVLEKARVAVELLKKQLEEAELTAPFAGIVADVQVEVGDQVGPGQVVIVLASLDRLEVRTTDLTELDVARVATGQSVQVTADALPGREFAGIVSEIALQGQDYRGDVVYEVVIEFDRDQDVSVLRWGMTTMVEIKTR